MSIKGDYQRLLAAQASRVKWMVQAMAPVDSGALQRDISCHMQSVNHMVLTMGDNTYYAPYTEEKWINRPGTNPNEGWFSTSVDNVARYLGAALGGTLSTPYSGVLDEIESNSTIDTVANANSKAEATN